MPTKEEKRLGLIQVRKLALKQPIFNMYDEAGKVMVKTTTIRGSSIKNLPSDILKQLGVNGKTVLNGSTKLNLPQVVQSNPEQYFVNLFIQSNFDASKLPEIQRRYLEEYKRAQQLEHANNLHSPNGQSDAKGTPT